MEFDSHLEAIEEQASLLSLGLLDAQETANFQRRVQAGCPHCAALLADCERAVAALPLLAAEVAPPPRLRARLLESIGVPQTAPAVPGVEGTIVRSNDTEWESMPVPGVTFRRLLGRKTMLVRMAPNTYFPEHEHTAAEQCLVLEGSVRSQGEVAYAGDFTYMPKGSKHQPLYSETGCLLLIAYT